MAAPTNPWQMDWGAGATPAAATPASAPAVASGQNPWEANWGGGGASAPAPSTPMRMRDLIVRQGIGQGTMAGFGDEAEAATRSAYDWLTGGTDSGEKPKTLGDLYNKYLTNARTINSNFEKQHPVASTVAQIGGATAPMLVPGVGEALGPLDEASLAGRAGNAAIQGGAYGAAYGAGTGEGTADRIEKALGGGVAGAMTGGLLTPLIEGATQIGSRFIAPRIRAAFTPTEEAGNRLGLAADQNDALPPNVGQPQRGLTDQQVADAQAEGFHPNNIDRLGEQGRSLADAAATASPQARSILNQTLNDNHLAQFPQLNGILDDMVQGQGSLETRAQLRTAARAQNQHAYDAAYSNPNGSDPTFMWSPELQNMMAAKSMKDALSATLGTASNEAVLNGHIPIKNPFSFDANNRVVAQPGVAPNLPFWDQMQRNLRDIVEDGTDLTGKMTNEARQADQLRDRLLGYMDYAVPEFRQARQGAAGAFGMEDMLDLGRQIVNSPKAMTNDQVMQARLTASPAERELARIGIVDALKQKFGGVKDAADLSKQVLSDPNERTKVGLFLGPDNMQRLNAAKNFLTMQGLARNAVQGNSKTMQRFLGSTALGAGGGVLYGEATGQNPWDDAMIGAGGLLSGQSLGEVGSHIINNRMAAEMARRLIANDPTMFNRGFSPYFRTGVPLGFSRWFTAPATAGAAQYGAQKL